MNRATILFNFVGVSDMTERAELFHISGWCLRTSIDIGRLHERRSLLQRLGCCDLQAFDEFYRVQESCFISSVKKNQKCVDILIDVN